MVGFVDFASWRHGGEVDVYDRKLVAIGPIARSQKVFTAERFLIMSLMHANSLMQQRLYVCLCKLDKVKLGYYSYSLFS